MGGAGAVVKRRECTDLKEVAATPLQLQLCQPHVLLSRSSDILRKVRNLDIVKSPNL